MIPQNLFPAQKKAPQKMARPVPVYMEVTPPGSSTKHRFIKEELTKPNK